MVRIGGILYSLLTSSVLESGFEQRLDQTKDYKISICCFSAKHTTLMSRDRLTRNQNRHVYPHIVVSVSYGNPTKRVGLVQTGEHYHIIERQLVFTMI